MEDLIANPATSGQKSDAGASVPAFEYPKEAIISYAQTREDVLLWRALHAVQHGFYVDVGAHDPTALSVTRAFYDHGWHGINVEPNPAYAEKLRNERPRDVTLEVALGHEPGMAMFYEYGDTGLSTMVKEIADEHVAAGLKATERRVPVTTLSALLDDLGDQQVHFLKIDVEGYERQVLRGADFSRVRPWVVLIEATMPTTSIPSHGTWESLLLEAGYEFVYFDGLNRFYIAEEHTNLGRYFSIPVNIFDPFRDSEMVRLSGAVAELERNKLEPASLLARLEVRTHELSSALTRAEFIQPQRELETENARRDAAAAREAATELQNLALRLHEELRSGRIETQRLHEELRSGRIETQRLHEELRSGRTATQRLHEELRSGQIETQRLHEELRSGRDATVELQQALRLAEERAEHAARQVAELQHSRWRHLGLLLGLARKATFER
jgi:FkbM family methyltransferase